MPKELIFKTSSFFLQVANTCQPFCDKYFAVSRPMPEEQPVIKMLLNLSSILFSIVLKLNSLIVI